MVPMWPLIGRPMSGIDDAGLGLSEPWEYIFTVPS
jgi:hypothetical protein